MLSTCSYMANFRSGLGLVSFSGLIIMVPTSSISGINSFKMPTVAEFCFFCCGINRHKSSAESDEGAIYSGESRGGRDAGPGVYTAL